MRESRHQIPPPNFLLHLTMRPLLARRPSRLRQSLMKLAARQPTCYRGAVRAAYTASAAPRSSWHVKAHRK
jgi:hypothetical protein